MSTVLRRGPAVVLVVVLALLPVQAWTKAGDNTMVLRSPAGGLSSVTWTGSVAPDGRLAVRIAYDIDSTERTLDIRLPHGARLLAVDGAPLAADIGQYATAAVRGPTVVTYEVQGAVIRYADGAVLRLARAQGSSEDGDEGLFPCPRCYIDGIGYGNTVVYGAIYAPGAEDAEVLLTQLDPFRTGTDTGVVRFTGLDEGADAVSMVVTLPTDAVPDLAVSPGSVADAVAAARGELREAGVSFHAAAAAGSGRTLAAVVLTAMFLAILVWIGSRFRAVRREAAAAHDDRPVPVGAEGAFSKPDPLEPALVSLVMGAGGPGERSAVAGTILELARRGVVGIEGIDSERFTLHVPAGARGSTTFEEAVLARLRPQGQVTASAVLTGPPLWGPDGDAIARQLSRVLVREGFRRHLVRLQLSALVLVPASIALGVVALVASGGLSAIGWFAVFAGPVLAVAAAVLGGTRLTGAGVEARRRWTEYGRWLRSNTQLQRVGAPGVAMWGEVLPHAAAIGAAPVAARALSPREGM